MKLIFSPFYTIEVQHKFKTEKFQLTVDELLKKKIIKKENIIEPQLPQERDLLLAHGKEWVKKVVDMELTGVDILAAEMPISRDIIFGHLFHTGGTILASEIALKEGLGLHCGGGAHHAHKDYGAGFCLINDIAVATKKILKEKPNKKILIIDLDVHQGDGTAEILKDERNVFTFSMHSAKIYPEVKEKSCLDVELPPGTDGKKYNEILDESLNKISKDFEADFVFYNAGADVYKKDMLGDLSLDFKDIEKRDEMVFSFCKDKKIPLTLTLSGGYAENIKDTVKIHFNTIKKAVEILKL